MTESLKDTGMFLEYQLIFTDNEIFRNNKNLKIVCGTDNYV